MHRGMITCRTDATLGQVAVMLTQHRIHAIYVADRENRVTGMLTDFDLLTGEWLSTDEVSLSAMRSMTAGELMSTPPATIEAEAPIAEAARLMKDKDFKRLLALQDGQEVGVLSISDLIASLAPSRINRGTVADVMSRIMLVCRKETPVSEIARGLTYAGYRSVLVVNGDGRPIGVVSGLDFLDAIQDASQLHVAAEKVMHPALTIEPTASLREAADMMIEQHHHRLIVVDPDDHGAMPIGIISSVDIVAEMAQPGSVWQKA
jgi:CBS domain-containing protein